MTKFRLSSRGGLFNGAIKPVLKGSPVHKRAIFLHISAFSVISGCQMVLALCFASMSACDVPISLVHPIEIGQGWFTKNKLMPNSMFWWVSLCMNLAVAMQEFIFFAAQE